MWSTYWLIKVTSESCCVLIERLAITEQLWTDIVHRLLTCAYSEYNYNSSNNSSNQNIGTMLTVVFLPLFNKLIAKQVRYIINNHILI